jgi:glutamyl-Q tRNA(Asp) synthetase
MGAASAAPSIVMTIPAPESPYIGRFAPSPSGPLHFGSLVSAVASYLDAKAHNGTWLVRMDDLDPPREISGAADLILQQLQQHSLNWDGDILYQSQRSEAYLATLEKLQHEGLIYPCQCSRQQLKEQGGLHHGRCQLQDPSALAALRLAAPVKSQIEFEDIFQGQQNQNIKQEVGDVVLHRKDGLFAYQLAVVVDDAYQQISHVIRGSDLLSSTPRQICLQQLLGLPTPLYGHIPVVTNLNGQKLSKQNLTPSIDAKTASTNLTSALQWLGLPLPKALYSASGHELLNWGVEHWQRKLIPPVMEKLIVNRST